MPHPPDDDPLADDEEANAPGLLRPYVITGGRTRGSGADLPVEAIVQSTFPTTPPPFLGPEERIITELCASPISIAEVAAKADLPLGVARVLVSDLVTSELLQTHETNDVNSPDILQQLIDGIRAL